MKKFTYFVLFLLYLFCLHDTLSAIEEGKYIYNQDGTIDFQKSYKIFLDSEKSKEEKVQLNFDNYDILPPNECHGNTYVCEESTEIFVITKKHWKLFRVNDLTKDDIKSDVFAKYLPDITPSKEINNTSPIKDRLIVQKILYDRGLLPTKPTGKIGWLTEQAVIKFQYLKNIDEFDHSRKIAVIGPKTIAALNELKNKMKDPNYLKQNPLPKINENDLPNHLKKRMNELSNLLQKSSNNNISVSNTEIIPIKPSYLKFGGKAEIKKYENR